MGDRDKRRRPGTDDRQAAESNPTEGGAETAFDLWLQRGLHRLYDDVAKEPLPTDLLALIEAHRGRRPQ